MLVLQQLNSRTVGADGIDDGGGSDGDLSKVFVTDWNHMGDIVFRLNSAGTPTN